MHHTTIHKIAFDNIEALQTCIEEEFGSWGQSIAVDQTIINAFAELTTDRQWIHIDPERARNGPFGTTVAHGFLLLSMLPAIRPANNYQLTGWTSALTYGIRALRFLRPVPSHHYIHAQARLLSVEAHRAGTLLAQEIAIHAVGDARPAIVFELQVLYA